MTVEILVSGRRNRIFVPIRNFTVGYGVMPIGVKQGVKNADEATA